MTAGQVSELFDLTGKTAIITGGGGCIGGVYGRALSNAGARVVLADLNADAAESTAQTLRAEGFEVIATKVDITSPVSAAAMAAVAVEAFAGIDILVNNAALMSEVPQTRLVDLPTDWFERIMGVNVMGVVVCARAVLDSMIGRGGGRIVNGSSAGGFMGGGIYGISKYALHSATVSLASELGPLGINVNGIAPGLVENDAGYRSLGADHPMRVGLKMMIPGKKEAPAEDLVGTLLLLCSKAGDWINGQTYSVDGGWIKRL